ncbi:hypothetical protein [Streptomyces albipurpureus]|uniref:Uncharacterized protein n=1 Tax=Streptomyces albipurpureus TaxID=2897419 RepID=A0ABT0UW34_9ACTN|nr:hypothetical protein [Streptomyces sp. CWNU-1]MCM2392612.1 hypothetical protein [Streptomyces sp. CWNU-1]
MTSKTQAPTLDGVNWRKRDSELPSRYNYTVGMLKPEETTSGLGYMVDCNQSETKWAAYCFTADNSQWWAAHGDGNPQDVLARLEVADGKDYAAVQQIGDGAAFEQLATIDWDNVPVAAGDHHASFLLAGKVRDHKDYCQPEHTHLRSTVEGWLSRYSAVHAHRSEN